jgi:hypothetical protein
VGRDQRAPNREWRTQQLLDGSDPLSDKQALSLAGFSAAKITRQREQLQAFIEWDWGMALAFDETDFLRER